VTTQYIKYAHGYKNVLKEDVAIDIGLKGFAFETDYIVLDVNGLMTIKKGYAWDGVSGPTYDDQTNIGPSLFHDAGCQSMRLGLLPEWLRAWFDDQFVERCRRCGMNRFRAWYYRLFVPLGKNASKKGYEPYPTLTAPI